MELEQRVQCFATKVHAGQYRKDGKTPYIKHCEAVVSLLKRTGVKDDNIISSAWLHDVIEDCNVKKEFLEKEFNPEVARIVMALTRDCSRQAYKERIKNADYSVQIVKIADVVHNCQTLNGRISSKTINRKVEDCRNLYLSLAQKVSPILYREMSQAIGPWMRKK